MRFAVLLLMAALWCGRCFAGDLDEMSAEQVIERLGLQPLTVEGGYFKVHYVAEETYLRKDLPKRFDGDRHFNDATYFLITKDSFSPFHKVNNNEIWIFCAGDPAVQTTIDKDAELKQVTLGSNITKDQTLIGVISPEAWQSTRLLPGGRWALFVLSTSPAFEYSDYTGATDAEILKRYPQHSGILSGFYQKTKRY
jgi:uncharacterized protein